MLNIFKKKNDSKIYAPINGQCIDIVDVNDIGFSSKMMGDGVAIIPSNNTVVSPADGTLMMVFKTGHAFGIKTNDGLELLIHIGIDTVNEEGRGFKIFKNSGDKVKKGTPIIGFDLNSLEEKYDMTTMIIVTNKVDINKMSIGESVNINIPLFERKKDEWGY